MKSDEYGDYDEEDYDDEDDEQQEFVDENQEDQGLVDDLKINQLTKEAFGSIMIRVGKQTIEKLVGGEQEFS